MLNNYIKLALKVLLRRKFYTFVSLFGIAFTLTILTVATALFDDLLAAAPPESRCDRMLAITFARMTGPNFTSSGNPGYALLDRYARDLPGVEKLSIASEPRTAISYVDGTRIETQLRRTDGNYWEILDFEFLEGGPYTEVDAEAGRFGVVINETTRKRFFGERQAIGGAIHLDNQLFQVVGVVRDVSPKKLSFAEAWAPLSTFKSTTYKHELRGGFAGVLLARDRASFAAIKAEYARRLAEAELPEPERYERLTSAADTRTEMLARSLLDDTESEQAPVQRFLGLVGLAIILFMSLPAINLVNLNLSRILERSSEIGVRKAFGASVPALVGQFIVESVVLSSIGGLIGFAFAILCVDLLNRSDLIPYAAFSVNLRVFAAGMGLAIVFGLLSGAYPAWRMSRLHPVESIQGRV